MTVSLFGWQLTRATPTPLHKTLPRLQQLQVAVRETVALMKKLDDQLDAAIKEANVPPQGMTRARWREVKQDIARRTHAVQ